MFTGNINCSNHHGLFAVSLAVALLIVPCALETGGQAKRNLAGQKSESQKTKPSEPAKSDKGAKKEPFKLSDGLIVSENKLTLKNGYEFVKLSRTKVGVRRLGAGGNLAEGDCECRDAGGGGGGGSADKCELTQPAENVRICVRAGCSSSCKFATKLVKVQS